MKTTFNILFCFILIFLCNNKIKAQDGTKIIMKDGKYGMVMTLNKLPKEVIKPQFDSILPFYKGQVYLYKRKGKWGIFNAFIVRQEVYPITDSQFDKIIFLKELQHNEKGDYIGATAYFWVKKDGKTAILSFPLSETTQKYNISPLFDEIGTTPEEIKSNFKKLFYVKKDNLYGIYNARGLSKQPIEYTNHQQYPGEKNITYHALNKNNENYLFVDNPPISYPLMKADSIWYDRIIYLKNKKDTLSFYGGGLKPIKEVPVPAPLPVKDSTQTINPIGQEKQE